MIRDRQENRPDPHSLPLSRQFFVLGALAVVATAAGIVFLGFTILAHGEARAQVPPPLSHFIPPRQQLAALEIEPVKLGIVHDAVGDRTAATIPARAVIYQGDAARVWVAGDDGSLSLREVTLGAALGDAMEVRRGLSPGEKIITNGSLFTDPALIGQ